ncbi:hypothetical protein OJF2_65950 [Aquisphaera giovannonii]|uniref:Glycosyltransferase RgtA/B/C/D-like domain-containing protein n=1 Tax=Aquisphaera giovannonii TaxID=406548 RepID=A0A5B9WCN7_9BACT|nr:hypothetical protein [Aquisphaera giovannonii]QEH37999.1 hypothetical protein OJF2_65950 [Aquisphaera giovannonii]
MVAKTGDKAEGMMPEADASTTGGEAIRAGSAGAWRAWLIGLVYWISLLPITSPPRHSGNVWSRYMTIESLVERGTLAIERSPLLAISGSPDQVKIGPHLYSDKPPMLSAIAAGLYAPLHRVAGWKMSRPGDFSAVNAALVWGIVGLSSALALAGLRRLLGLSPVRPIVADLLTLAFGYSSLLLSYGVTFNNHSVAAGLITWALAIVATGARGARAWRGEFAAGFLAGLGATIDLPAGGFVTAALAVWLAARRRGLPLAYLIGCGGPLLAAAWLQLRTSGSPLPVEMNPRLFDYEGSYWTTGPGRWVERGPRWRFGLELLFGPQGWLTVTPALLLGVIGAGWVASRRGDPMRPLGLVVLATILVLAGYYTWGVRRTDFAGLSYGTRHLLAISPATFALAVILVGRSRSKAVCAVLALLIAVGAVYAIAGMKDPWSRIERRDDSGLRLVKSLALYPWSSYAR